MRFVVISVHFSQKCVQKTTKNVHLSAFSLKSFCNFLTKIERFQAKILIKGWKTA